MYAIKDNKCHEDITDRTPKITTLADLGYDDTTSLEYIIQTDMNDNGILVYSVSNIVDDRVYPIKVPTDDSAIVIINKANNCAAISFNFYDSIYVNHYSYGSLAGWIKLNKTELPQYEFKNIPSGYNFTAGFDLEVEDGAHVNVTLLTENSFIGDKPKIDYLYYVKNNRLYLHCKNNSSSTLASVLFKICIL